ncbi:MAG: hypothetical protein H0X71_00275 [Rubrobacter sp.]|nr:hypothetical protein [Rubrobacter sp.]
MAPTVAALALAKEESALATGTLQRQGITACQYSTHIVSDEASGTFHALSSDVIYIDAYVGQRVTIYGIPAPGYESGEAEGGPPLVDVAGVAPEALVEAPFYDSFPGLHLQAGVSLTSGRCSGNNGRQEPGFSRGSL